VAIPSEAAGRRVLVTGASGFTGRYVIQALQETGQQVVALAAADGSSVDLLDRSAVEAAVRAARADVVVHLAAIAFVAHGDVDEMYRVNIVGTRNLLAALAGLEQPPSQVILASSANVYGNSPGSLDEQVPPQPVNDYAVSKLAMELMARQFADRLPLTIVRPFNYTGVGQSVSFLIPKIVDHFKRRAERLELGNLHVSRDFNDVRNVAMTYSRLSLLPGTGEVFNICSGHEHTLLEVVSMMEEIAGYRPEVTVNPAFVRPNEVKKLIGDPSKIDAVVGPLPRWDLRQTLQWMYESA
jgi:nucleoside-diphosphate-sugar epimerase